MPKAPAFTPKPPVEKLPLAVRKDIRDNYEVKKEEYETKIGELLGVPFKLNIDANAVWAYNEDTSSSAGRTFSGYVDGFIYALKWLTERYGDEGKNFFNQVVTESELRIGVHPLGDKGETISTKVIDGVFWILFRHNQLGYNQNSVSDSIVKALEGVPKEGFSLRAKHSIEEEYNSEIDDLTKEIGELIGIPDVIIDPNFEEVYQALLKSPDTDWQTTFGAAIYGYFKEGLKNTLESNKFGTDDMLQEGLQEAVPSKTFKFRIVDKLVKGYCNETIIEDGVVYLQTTVEKWRYNTRDICDNLVNLL